MNDLHTAYLVLRAVSRVDGGCVRCVRECVDEAIRAHPNLPWEEAAQLLRPKSDMDMMVEAVQSTRSVLGNTHRKFCPYVHAVDRTYGIA